MTRERLLAEGTEDAKPVRGAPSKQSATRSMPAPASPAQQDPLALHRLLDSFGVLSTYRAKLFAAVLTATLVPSFIGILIAMFGAHRMSVGTLIVLLFLLAIAGATIAVWSVHCLLAPVDAACEALDAHAERRDVARIDVTGTDAAAQLVRGVQSLVAQIKSQDDERHKLESRDSTTGLYSRRAGRSKAQAVIDHHCKHGRVVRVIAVRIDSFGAFNDAHGYGHGDALLKAVAARIERVAGQDGVSMRWSGDEFMLARAVSPGEPADFLEGLGRSIVLKGAEDPITLSLGVAQTDTGVPFESLAARAEEMLASERRRRAERAGG